MDDWYGTIYPRVMAGDDPVRMTIEKFALIATGMIPAIYASASCCPLCVSHSQEPSGSVNRRGGCRGCPVNDVYGQCDSLPICKEFVQVIRLEEDPMGICQRIIHLLRQLPPRQTAGPAEEQSDTRPVPQSEHC